MCVRKRYGGFVAPAAARCAGPVLDQHHVRFLFQEMFLRGLHDAVGYDRHSHLYREKRRPGRGEHAVSNERSLARHCTEPLANCAKC